MKDKIEKLKSEMLAELKKAENHDVVRDIEVKYLGRKGLFTDIMKGQE